MKICPACSREYGDEHESCLDDGVVLVRLDTGTNSRAQDLIGKIVDGRYRVERIIGRGGMGTVYACSHVVVGKLFAMKVLRPGIERSEEILQRFIREAQAANAVKSRHICEMTDFGQLANGAFYVVMELLEGHSLTRALREKRLDRRELKHVFIQIAETLFRAHEANIIHRDLKPDNVMLVDDEGDPNFVKMVDFGIAKITHAQASNLTETGVILGTPYYMSPEQARGDQLDHRSDIYALGVMMYRAFTGRLPFVADTAMGVLTRHLTEKPELPSKITEIDPQLEHLILRCLEKKPIDRFQTMMQVAHALRSITDEPKHDPIGETTNIQTGKRPPKVAPTGEPTPTRLASPMAKSQQRPAWTDGNNRAQAASQSVPQSQAPPKPRSNPPTAPHIPAAAPVPKMPSQHNLPSLQHTPSGLHPPGNLPYPHAMTAHAIAQQSSGSHPIPGGIHGGPLGSSQSYPGIEPQLPVHMQGEAATNRGVSARIETNPQPRRWPFLLGAAAIALFGVGVGVYALSSNNVDGTAPSPAVSTEAESDEEPTPPAGGQTAAPEPTPAPSAAPSASASAGSEADKPAPRVPRPGPRRQVPQPPEPKEDDPKPNPKPVDDVRDPFAD